MRNIWSINTKWDVIEMMSLYSLTVIRISECSLVGRLYFCQDLIALIILSVFQKTFLVQIANVQLPKTSRSKMKNWVTGNRVTGGTEIGLTLTMEVG